MRDRATGAFAVVTALFFVWEFVTSLVDPLVAAVKNIFSLTNTEAQLSAFAFFIAYGVVSLPGALLLRRLGAVWGIVVALGLMAVGCLIMLFASNIAVYEGVLAGLFVIASGITILQVAANPLAAARGPPERSHFRLTFSQAFNSVGTVLGPLLGARLFLHGLDSKPGEVLSGAARHNALGAIDSAFLMIAGFDDSPAGLLAWPMLTTVRQPMQKLGASAALMLLGEPLDPAAVEHELIIRGSTTMSVDSAANPVDR